jgi:hypothetical protein
VQHLLKTEEDDVVNSDKSSESRNKSSHDGIETRNHVLLSKSKQNEVSGELLDFTDHPEKHRGQQNDLRPRAKASPMTDAPTRGEISAKLQAAEARNETRFEQLSSKIEARATASDHKMDIVTLKIDALAGALTTRMDTLSSAVSEVKSDGKTTRNTMVVVGVGSVVAVVAAAIALWSASIGVQSNMIAQFNTALAIRSISPNLATASSPGATKASSDPAQALPAPQPQPNKKQP